MIRVLHFIYGLNIGGAESFIANVIETADSNKLQFGIAIQNPDITNSRLKNLIENRGIEIHYLPRFPYHVLSQYTSLKRLIRVGKYSVIHIHANSLVNPIPLMVARSIKGLKIIIHSHSSSSQKGGIISLFGHHFNKRMFLRSNSLRIACSDDAAHWMFGKMDYKYIPNALNIAYYEFSQSGRDRIRTKYSIALNDIVLGSVGRLVYAKNHKFMFQLFKEFNYSFPNSKLLIVGDGPLMEELRRLSSDLGIEKYVIFAGAQNNVRDFYSAMDCFLLTSHFEGLPFTAMEAQANGLPVVASNRITREIQLSDNVIFTPRRTITQKHASCKDKNSNLSSNDDSIIWIELIKQLLSQRHFGFKNNNPLAGSPFDIQKQIEDMNVLYTSE